MPQSKARRVKGHGETVPPLSKLERIGELLKVQSETFPQKELSPEEIGRWEQDLKDFPLPAIEFAFDTHRRNGMYFPVPGQILDLCIAWEPEAKYARGCSKECKAQHGKGYHWNDIYWLMHKLKAPCVVGPEHARTEPLKPGELEALFDELDSKRPGGAPEWRA